MAIVSAKAVNVDRLPLFTPIVTERPTLWECQLYFPLESEGHVNILCQYVFKSFLFHVRG